MGELSIQMGRSFFYGRFLLAYEHSKLRNYGFKLIHYCGGLKVILFEFEIEEKIIFTFLELACKIILIIFAKKKKFKNLKDVKKLNREGVQKKLKARTVLRFVQKILGIVYPQKIPFYYSSCYCSRFKLFNFQNTHKSGGGGVLKTK